MRQIAIFGGTFDPIHIGHLIVAQAALDQINLEKVIWVPSLNPPHKQAALFEHRLKMLQLATTDNPAFTVSHVDVNSQGNSYAINTFLELSTFYINTHWYWIVGLDTFQTLPRWYRIAELAQQCDWLIAPRLLNGQTINESELICKQVEQNLAKQLKSIQWQLLHIPLVGISSSLIRNRCRDAPLGAARGDRQIRYLVPESVRAYIAKHNLYRG